MSRSLPRSFYRALAVLLLGANFFAWRAILMPRELSVRVLAAGEGVAVLVTAPSGKRVLINSGPDASILRALGEALPPWQRSLDALILTDISAKTSGGAPHVLERYATPLVLRPEMRGSKAQEAALASGVTRSRVVTASRGKRITFGGASADILWPPSTPSPMTGSAGGLALLLSDGVRTYLIYDHLPPRVVRLLPPATIAIASSTPPGQY